MVAVTFGEERILPVKNFPLPAEKFWAITLMRGHRTNPASNPTPAPGQRRTTMTTITRLIQDESGATAIEYGLIAALVSVVIIGALTTLGSNLSTLFASIASTVSVGS